MQAKTLKEYMQNRRAYMKKWREKNRKKLMEYNREYKRNQRKKLSTRTS